MTAGSEYELLDLGDGRRLERFGRFVVDRPFPAATESPADPGAWTSADLRFERELAADGRWDAAADELPGNWLMRHDDLIFELRNTPSGQVGFFAEQREPWQWLRAAIEPGAAADPPAVLNLFAYTGGATLAAAAAGAAVTHVDASRPAVAWARRNAELSGLAEAPIRWIVDDALGFVRREGRRGRRYRGLVLDPPSYGHGVRGERWSLDELLPDLLDESLALLEEGGFVLLTAHPEGLAPDALAAALADAFARAGRGDAAADVAGEPLILRAASGASAPAGVVARSGL